MPERKPERKPSSYDELFPGRFLKAGLFFGKELTLRIVDVRLEMMPDKKGTIVNADGERCKNQAILTVETPAGRKVDQEIALNKTNANCIAGMFGKQLRGEGGWVGRLVTFGPRRVEAFGEEVDAIRVVGSPDMKEAEKTFTFRCGRSDKTVTMKRTPMPVMPAPPAPKGQGTATNPPSAYRAPPTPPDAGERGGGYDTLGTPPPVAPTPSGDHEPTDEELEAAREDVEAGFNERDRNDPHNH